MCIRNVNIRLKLSVKLLPKLNFDTKKFHLYDNLPFFYKCWLFDLGHLHKTHHIRHVTGPTDGNICLGKK